MESIVDKVQNITLGAEQFEQSQGELNILRFTKEQQLLYENRDEGFYNKTFCTAGIKLSFKTDSTKLFLKLRVSTAKSTRKYFSVDVLVNDTLVDYIDNFSNVNLPDEYTQVSLPDGIVSKEIFLGNGLKKVCIHLPRLSVASIIDISVDDGALIESIKPSKKMLVFGDSITQGYDVLRPSNHHIAKLADKLDAEEKNLAIGGEIFFPELASTVVNSNPDYIIVGYGTNDWSKTAKDDFKERCYKFYKNLSLKYPDSKIFAITPIWRKNFEKDTLFDSFFDVEKIIRENVSNFSNIVVVDGWDLVPHDEKYFADLVLHPNDNGFKCYYDNIVRKNFRKEEV